MFIAFMLVSLPWLDPSKTRVFGHMKEPKLFGVRLQRKSSSRL
jgi:hypothetical protein